MKSLNELSTQNSALGNKLHAGAFISVHSRANHSSGGVKHCALASMQNYIAVCLLRSFKSTEVRVHTCFFVRIHCAKRVETLMIQDLKLRWGVFPFLCNVMHLRTAQKIFKDTELHYILAYFSTYCIIVQYILLG